jgi:predicted glycogen debranching enzyme
MDAKAGDWVVTPRRGKAVEINALWYNALRLMQGWLADAGDRSGAERMQLAADRTYQAFNRRFWNPECGHLNDVVDGEHGDDPACRPNQLFAMSLPNPVLAFGHATPVLRTNQTRAGERQSGCARCRPRHPTEAELSLPPGDLVTRDAAYRRERHGAGW